MAMSNDFGFGPLGDPYKELERMRQRDFEIYRDQIAQQLLSKPVSRPEVKPEEPKLNKLLLLT